MKKYRRKATQWQQKDNEEKQMNKTEFIKVRCTLEEKQRIKEKAESTGRKFSEYCREILLNGEAVAVPKMTDNEKEAIAVLHRTGMYYDRFPTSSKSRTRIGYISPRTFLYVPKRHLSDFTTRIFVWTMRYIRS